MNHYQVLIKWGVVINLLMSLLSGCGAASPTPIALAPTSTSPPPPPPAIVPPAVLLRPTAVPATATTKPVRTEPTTTPGGTVTLEPSPTLKPPIDRPFLMKIDRISVVAGRGTLLEGRVANGALQANGDVEILDTQNKVISPAILAIFISNTVRDQVTVGDYAGILVANIEASDLSPGMLLAAAGEYKSYDDALKQLR